MSPILRALALQAPTPSSTDALPADLRGADLRGMDLTDADLARRDLSGANLEGAVLFGAQLEGAMFIGANLRGADLREVSASRANFGRADLSEALMFGAVCCNTSFGGAKLHNADLSAAVLVDANFSESDLTGASLARAVARSAVFDSANLANASFESTELERARFSHARNYDQARWIDADLVGGDFRGAHALHRYARDQNYLLEFRERNRSNRIVYAVWKLTSDCGRSLGRWLGFIMTVAVAFAIAYTQVGIDFGDHETWLSPFYFSIVTLTTLGFGDALPTTVVAQVVVILQVMMGYLFLGGLVTILANKLARRAG